MKFFLDNHLPPCLARALDALSKEEGYSVTHLREKFSNDIADEEYIRQLGEEGNWVIVSGDLRILSSPHERKAWQESGLTMFFLERGWAHIGLWNMAWKMVKWWPEIISQAERITRGVGFRIPVRGAKLKLLNF